jgi:hypothetical protein
MEPLARLGETMRTILTRAILAPSGDNLQPWHFIIRGEALELWNVPSSDTTPHDWNERASHIACGAVLENIRLAASACNLEAHISYFPDPASKNHVATVRFVSKPSLINPLSHFIERRCSNRKPYLKKPLTEAEQKTLTDPLTYSGLDVEVKIEIEPKKLHLLARAGALYERLIFGNQALHTSFFDHLGDTQNPLSQQKGLYSPTLELTLLEAWSLKVLKFWPVTLYASYLGLDRFIALKGARKYSASGGIGCITMQDTSAISFVKAGIALQRLWLTATSLNLNFQVLSGASLLKLMPQEGHGVNLRRDQVKLLHKALKNVEEIFETRGKPLCTLFRVGHGKPPSELTERLPLECFVTIVQTKRET